MPKPRRKSRNINSSVCVDVFTKMGDIEPMKDKEVDTYNIAMANIFKRLGVPDSFCCDEWSGFTNSCFL